MKNRNAMYVGLLILTYVVFYLVDSEWIYNSIGWVDAWIYFGAMYNPVKMRSWIPENPAGDLLPLTLPAGLFYQFFSPLLANFLYKMVCFVMAGFFFLRAAEIEFGLRTAVLGLITFLSSKFFLTAIGNDYTLGRVIVLYSATVYYLVKAGSLKDENEKPALFWAGLCFALTVSTALMSLVYAPGLALLYFGTKWVSQNKISNWMTAIVIPGFGFVVGVLLLCVIHYSYTGKFIYFQNTLAKATMFMGMKRTLLPIRWADDWLNLCLYTFSGIAILLLAKKQALKNSIEAKQINRALIVVGASLLNFLVLAFLQVARSQQTITNWGYFNQQHALLILAASAVFFAPWVESISKKTFQWIAGVYLFTTLVVFWVSTHLLLRDFFFNHYRIWLGLAFALVFFGLYFKKRYAEILFVTLALCLLSNIWPDSMSYLFNRKRSQVSEKIPSKAFALELTAKWVTFVDQVDPERKHFLWYDNVGSDPNEYVEGFVCASHFWGGRVYNRHFPNINVGEEEGMLHFARLPGQVPYEHLLEQPLLIISHAPNLLQVAEQNLKTINYQLKCGPKIEFQNAGTKYFDVYSCKAEHL